MVAPAAGFGLGLIGDMKLMRHMHGRSGQQPDGAKGGPERAACVVHALVQSRPAQQPDGAQERGPKREASAVHALDAPEPSDQVDEPRVIRGA